MQKQVELTLEEIFENNIAKIQGDTVKITVQTVTGNQLKRLDQEVRPLSKDMILKRSGTGITILATIK